MDTELQSLHDMLNRQILRRDKEIKHNGFASKKVTNQISKTRLLISMKHKAGSDTAREVE